MKGFGYDGVAHSSSHQSVTPKLVACLSRGGLKSVCSRSIRVSSADVCLCVRMVKSLWLGAHTFVWCRPVILLCVFLKMLLTGSSA